jgi:uncharacterized protein (DUF342 family)
MTSLNTLTFIQDITPKNVFRPLSNMNLKKKSMTFSHGNTHITNVSTKSFNNCQKDYVRHINIIIIIAEMAVSIVTVLQVG